MWRETKDLMLLFWSALFVDGMVMRWQGRKGGRVVRWQGGEGERVVRWEMWEVLSFIQRWGTPGELRFHFFGYNVNQENEGGGMGSRISCVATGMERLPLDLPRAF